MSFKFNFGGSEDVKSEVDDGKTEDVPQLPAEEIENEVKDLQKQQFDVIWVCPNLSLFKGNVGSNQASITLKSGVLAVSDLVPGRYEGGFKLWECAIDLAIYLCTLWSVTNESELSSSFGNSASTKKVLDLGCGHGLPGILAACLGMQAHFQDYNKEVLTGLTMSNVQKNMSAIPAANNNNDELPQPRYFSGSWDSFSELMRSKNLSASYDYIFSSDTIYSLASQKQLLHCIHEALKPGGEALIAAKSFYFGVGGSVVEFKRLALEHGGFKLKDGPIIDDGASNKREIFSLLKL